MGPALCSADRREIHVRLLLALLVERSGQALGPLARTRAFGMMPRNAPKKEIEIEYGAECNWVFWFELSR